MAAPDLLGDVAALGSIWALLSSGTTWIMGADRAQAVAGFDGAAPRWFGVFSKRWGTPIVVNLLSGILSTIVMFLAFALTSGDAEVLQRRAVAGDLHHHDRLHPRVPGVIKLRYSHPHVPRPDRVPGGMAGAWIVSVLTTGWAALATVALLLRGRSWDLLPIAQRTEPLPYQRCASR